MSPSESIKLVAKKDSVSVKKGGVGKLKTEVRTKVPEPKTLKRNYHVNKAAQINRIIIKNKTAEPITTKDGVNNVYITYSPAVYKDAVLFVTNEMKEGRTFESNKLQINVKKVMPTTDKTGIKVQDLITMCVQSKSRIEKPIQLQLHLYYTKQSLMVQGHRKVGGVKGFKLFVEDFFQPCIERVVIANKEKIANTKRILDEAKTVPEEKESAKEEAEGVAKDVVNEVVNDLIPMSYDCQECEGKFIIKEKLNEHIKIKHKERKQDQSNDILECSNCEKHFKSRNELQEHVNSTHEQYITIQKESKFPCKVCNQMFQTSNNLNTHIQINHGESAIQIEAMGVIKLIEENFGKLHEDEKMEEDIASLKRLNSTSPKGNKGKNLKIKINNEISKPKNSKYSDIPPKQNGNNEIEEDFKLLQEECEQLKTENVNLRNHVKDYENVKHENNKLVKQLKDQEGESMKAIQSIAKKIEEETKKIENKYEEQIEAVKNTAKKQVAAINKQHQRQVNDLKQEKDKMMGDMTKMQTENDLTKEKIQSIEKNKKIHNNLKIFNAIVENGHDIPLGQVKETDECIQNEPCLGGCDKVSDLKRLQSLKRSGSIRICPQTKPDDRPFFKCEKCDFMTQNKEYFKEHENEHNNQIDNECPQCGYKTKEKTKFEKHVREMHGQFPYCNICNVGLWSQDAVKKHKREYHTAKQSPKTPPSFTTGINQTEHNISQDQQSETNKKRPCRYFSTGNGCKKGNSCDFDHSANIQAIPVVKVPKFCKDKEACVWKPQCKYVHPEDGEALPVRSVRSRPLVSIMRQDFGPQVFNQQPPDWRSIPPPTLSPTLPPPPHPAQGSQQEDQKRKTYVIQEFLRLMVPDIMCMNEFPNLKRGQM